MMASSQRSFVSKLTKHNSSDIRKNVANYQIMSKSDSSSVCSSSISLCDLVEPIDYEEFLAQHFNLLQKDSLRSILDFPSNDVQVKIVPRKIRTINHQVPKEPLEELPLYVQHCVDCFTRPWKVVEFSARHHSGSCNASDRKDKGALSPSSSYQEFEIDRELGVMSSSLEESVAPNTLYVSESCTPSSRQSIASLSSVSTCTDTLTPRGSWASFDLRSSVNDPLITGVLDRISPESVDQSNDLKRQEARQQALFELYPCPEQLMEKRLPTEMPMEHLGNRIYVKCLHLKLELEVEPIFASMAIYDAKEKKKLSENFYFDMNSESLRRMLVSHVPLVDISTQAREAVFDITNPSNELYLVIRLEKVLQGDIKDSVEPYLKDDKDKYRDKAKSNASDYCERLGKYRMPFAWTGIYLSSVFNGDGVDKEDRESIASASSSNSLDRKASTGSFDQFRKRATDMGTLTRRGSLERKMEKRRSWSPDDFANSIETFRPITITVASFFKQESEKMKDEELYKFLPELKRPAALMKKHKCIPGSIKIEISPAPEELKYAITPELAKIDPYPDTHTRPVKEVLEFPSIPILNPHYSYRNLLFVSMKELNFSTRAGSARNIAVRVQLMAGERQSDALKAIFGKSSCAEFSTEAYSAVNYHNKQPTFYDEIKIELPANLKQNHHILFTLFHVSCQKKPQEVQTNVETPVGYTWLPVLKDGHLNVGDFNLPVMVEAPPDSYSFIPPDVQLPGTKWLDNHRQLFSVTIDAVTSIHTLDDYLDKFIFMCECLDLRKVPPRIGEGNMEREFRKTLVELQCADQEKLVKSIQVILDKLIELLVTTYKIGGEALSLGQHVFETICQISDKTSSLQPESRYGRQNILSTYIQYQCKIPHPMDSKCKLASFHPSIITASADELNRSGSNSDLLDPGMSGSVDRSPTMRSEGCSSGSSVKDGLVRLLHEEIALNWVVASGTAAELSMTNSWMLFELMVKSMIEHLDHTNALNSPRKGRFPHQYTDDIGTLVHLVTTKVVGYNTSDPKLAQSINCSLAYFIFDLLSIMDRGFVYGLIKTYYKVIMTKSTSTPDMIQYKLDFLRIVCSHEHFVALNLPFGTSFTTLSAACSPTPSVTSNNSQNSYVSTITGSDRALYADLSVEFRQQHFLVGLVLQELSNVLEIPNVALHAKAINCLRDLLTSHDLDPRYSEVDARARVAALYLPLLGIVMDAIPQLNFPVSQSHDRWNTIGQLDDYQGPAASVPSTNTISPEVAFAISGIRRYSYVSESPKPKTALTNDTRHLLACFLWVLKNLEPSTLFQYTLVLSPHRVHQMLQVLNICLPNFEYRGRKQPLSTSKRNTSSFRKTPDMREKLEEFIRGTGSARNDLINRRKDGRNSSEKLRWKKDQIRAQFYDSSTKNEAELDICNFIEGSLATEVCLIVLDTLEMIVQVASSSEMHHSLLGTVLKVLLHALSRNQSTMALQNLFASQRSLVFKYHNLLFDEETDNCADLCLLLLKHCGSLLPTVRSQAAASLYLLMRQNFEIGNNFARIKMQVTMSLSSLVGTSSSFSEQSLRRALKTILVYAESDIDLQDTSFPEQVQDLLFNLHMILSDTVKMKEYQEDPEMLLDLMNRIAKGYQNSPDLRLTWLENMAKKHTERANHTEAAMCYVHSAALVAEYLSMLESQTHLPVGAVSFKHISPNALLESAVSDDVVSPGEDGICLGNSFTEGGLKQLLDHAASAFQAAGMYEAMNDVYKVLIPICEANRDFRKLAQIHGKLLEAFNRIAQLQGKRVFGTYFRVGFYGAKFGDLDQQEFIYKEPTLTKLPEIFSRLQNFYADRFGPDAVQIIKDSNVVDIATLDPEKAYIQITYVEPYFETYELRYKETYFERNFNIKRFIFATPFTKSGKAHGDLHEQCKKKTILTTANHFPYVKTRIQVIHRQQIVLEPIEVAIEDIQKKTTELAAATNQEPADPKILQMVLQGCIGTTVNQGPMEMAHVFLSSISNGNAIPTKQQNKLRLCFKDFSKKCADALKKNRNLILSDQKDYQKELERNYQVFTERLSPLITISATQTQGLLAAKSEIHNNNRLTCTVRF
ncbi:dedicator of cytokinesis protein 7-like [Anopheles albimanus]|uniref:Dedicator of cytokinesis protein 7 n=1 Tax=Anopheles albimanus TaxID=7167 RepID=A0A8W7JX64_ANOAL|nr:dedicator of cytokinesis protein 7-like [Anopheles albimanus]